MKVREEWKGRRKSSTAVLKNFLGMKFSKKPYEGGGVIWGMRGHSSSKLNSSRVILPSNAIPVSTTSRLLAVYTGGQLTCNKSRPVLLIGPAELCKQGFTRGRTEPIVGYDGRNVVKGNSRIVRRHST